MAKLTYRAASVERTTPVDRATVFHAARSHAEAADSILSSEPPWRLVTSMADEAVDLHEVTVSIVDAPGGGTLYSVSAVIGPETEPGALDHRLRAVITSLEARADAIMAATK